MYESVAIQPPNKNLQLETGKKIGGLGVVLGPGTGEAEAGGSLS